MAARLHGYGLAMTGGDQKVFGHDALQKRVDALGGPAIRRAEAIRALRRWSWLEALRLRFDLSLEILDADLEYVFDPLPERHVAISLRSALHGMGRPALVDTVAGVIRSTKPQTLTANGFRVRFLPLFIRSAASPTVLGVLAIGDPQPAPRRPPVEESVEPTDRRLDGMGQWLVAAIEAALGATYKEVGEARDAQRMAGSFDVIDALTQLQSDREIIALLMDAVALWYDADVHVYRQDLSGAFILHASLPGADAERAAPRLLGHHIWGRGEVFSPESRAELDELGWSASMVHTLFVPIAVDQSTEWLLAVSEAGDDPAIRETLSVFGRVASVLLSDLQHQAADRLARKLTSILLFSEAPFHATARLAFEAVAAETGASSVQFATFEVEEGRTRPALSMQWGGADTDVAPFVEAETTSLAPAAIAVGVGGSGVTAVLSLQRSTGAFAPSAPRLARSAASMIGVWLSGAMIAAPDVRVPVPGDYGAELLQRLRGQVDRFGHVRVGGAVAVVLPQAQASARHTLDEAVDLIEHHVRPSDVIGAVGAAGAGVLLADATRDVASAVVGRFLRAAKDKGPLVVRVGVAMFAAASESPESVLERAVMNARRGSAT
jgi:hypothetical protein